MSLEAFNMGNIERAISYFSEGYNCSQSLILTYGPQLGLSDESAANIGAPFGGGIGRMGEVCGAVTGAIMVMGLLAGKTKTERREIKGEAYRLTAEFSRMFKERNDTIICRELLGCDIGTPEGLESAQERNLFTTLCAKCVRDAAEIVEEIIELQKEGTAT